MKKEFGVEQQKLPLAEERAKRWESYIMRWSDEPVKPLWGLPRGVHTI